MGNINAYVLYGKILKNGTPQVNVDVVIRNDTQASMLITLIAAKSF